jgi:hypothetical protein
MPSRPLTLAIVVFWLATVGWFFARDVWPHWRPGDPPPYTIELADEALRQMVPVRWTFLRNGTKLGTIRTNLNYNESDDTFELSAFSKELKLAGLGFVEIQAEDYNDLIRVTRDGELRAMTTDVKLVVSGLGPEFVGHAHIEARMRRGRLERQFRLEAPILGTFAPELEPAPPIRGSVLNPTHPINRINGLRPGQHWRQPLNDPRSEIIKLALGRLMNGGPAGSLPETAPVALAAEVLPQPQDLEWEGVAHPCLVIEYRGDLQGDEITARTWVRQSDGLVLRQEVEAHGEKLVLQRE